MSRAAEMAAIYAAGFPESRVWSEAEFDDLLRDPTTIAVHAPLAFALFRVVPPEAEVLTVVVHPKAQGQGIGAALLRDGMRQAVARGALRLFLEVDAENRPAQALYDRCGFVRDGIRKSYYRHSNGSKSDAILMSCALDA